MPPGSAGLTLGQRYLWLARAELALIEGKADVALKITDARIGAEREANPLDLLLLEACGTQGQREAAMSLGLRPYQVLFKVVLPQAATGIAATAIFCLIFAWNEYAFAVLLTSGEAQTAPPFIPIIIGEGGQDWPAVSAGTTLFLIPILVFTVLLRKHLLRGITFGAVRK